MHSLPFFVTKLSFLKTFGSTTPEFTFVNILNSFETLASYPYEERPKEILPFRTCLFTKGLIIPFVLTVFLIHLSESTGILFFI